MKKRPASNPADAGEEGRTARLREAIETVALAIARELDWKRAAQIALQVAETALEADAAALWRAYPEVAVLRLTAQVGLPESAVDPLREVGYDDHLFMARAAREKRIQVVEQLPSPDPQVAIPLLWVRLGFRSLVAVPLPGREELTGVMIYLNRSPRHFVEAELEAIARLAEILGAGLENAWAHTQLDALLLGMPSALAVWKANPKGELQLTRVNEPFCRAVGSPCEQLQGLRLADVLPPSTEENGRLLEVARQVLQRGDSLWLSQHPIKGAGGLTTYWQAVVTPLKDPEGRIVGGIFSGQEITGEVLARQEVEESARRLRQANANLRKMARRAHEVAEDAESRSAELDAIIENINDGVVIAHPQQGWIRVNRRELEIMGLPSREKIPKTVHDLLSFHPRTQDGRLLSPQELPMSRVFRGETFSDMEMLIDTFDGRELDLMLAGSPILDSQGRVALGVTVARDITDLRRSEREREDFVRAVSHDLRGPLTAVLGQAQLIQRLADQPTAVEKAATAIVSSSRRMDSMIRDLTDIARLEMGKLEPKLEGIDMAAYLRDYLAGAAVSLDMQRVRTEIPEGLPRVRADRDWLARILDNLLSNALKYSTPGTEVRVVLRTEGAMVVCEITDQGVGIAPDELTHLFDRYYRGRRGATARKEGLGLGLYITRLLVEGMGGRIWAESRLGAGSTFGFSIPRAS